MSWPDDQPPRVQSATMARACSTKVKGWGCKQMKRNICFYRRNVRSDSKSCVKRGGGERTSDARWMCKHLTFCVLIERTHAIYEPRNFLSLTRVHATRAITVQTQRTQGPEFQGADALNRATPSWIKHIIDYAPPKLSFDLS